ncbi:hypothetical protein CAEBREN_23308 [Caenorhabditis brenneri]|uniref:Nuclear receptor domain-containing protein n=1 Tax=Caenorhabditis brenneri TaxID=135651 RepID=G0P057_CAEBE|nr:hypothetical protein CAEBREN_23308 [Caenorhabditis brenneri]
MSSPSNEPSTSLPVELDTFAASTEPSTSTPTETLCTVCGAQASGKRYGAVSCLGCIVFFRRTVLKKMKYRCQRDGNCEVTVETRCVCRHCRMEKCLKMGMNPDAIQIRDVIGPRRRQGSSAGQMSSRSTISPQTPFLPSPSSQTMSFPPSLTGGGTDNQEFDIQSLLQLQKSQWDDHKNYCEEEEKFTDGCVFMKNDYHHRATSPDINLSLKLAIQNSNQFTSQFKFFQDLEESQRSNILAEYSIGFMLIDQAFKTVQDADDGFWLLQNGSFLGLHPDFNFEEAQNEEAEKCHFDFVTQLLTTIRKPFEVLEVDETECVVLKTLLLCSVSADSENSRNQCLKFLMQHCSAKTMGLERFGEIVLLISSIRCAIKAFYNITKVSELFSVANFDQDVRDVLVQ